jgi:hypothetical protein
MTDQADSPFSAIALYTLLHKCCRLTDQEGQDALHRTIASSGLKRRGQDDIGVLSNYLASGGQRIIWPGNHNDTAWWDWWTDPKNLKFAVDAAFEHRAEAERKKAMLDEIRSAPPAPVA